MIYAQCKPDVEAIINAGPYAGSVVKISGYPNFRRNVKIEFIRVKHDTGRKPIAVDRECHLDYLDLKIS